MAYQRVRSKDRGFGVRSNMLGDSDLDNGRSPPKSASGGSPGGPGSPPAGKTVILAHYDGVDGGTGPFTNSALAGFAPVLQAIAGITTSATQAKFGTTSLSMGASGPGTSLVSGGITAPWKIGTGDFTVEFWYFTPTPTAIQGLFDYGESVTHTDGFGILTNVGGGFDFETNNSIKITGGTCLTNTWQAIAISRNNNVTRLFIDGVQVGSNYTDNNNYGTLTHQIYLGRINSGNLNLNGFFDEFRLTVGAGLYGANYTPAIAAFPAS